MSNKQRRWFIIVTLPLCCAILAVGISLTFSSLNRVDTTLRIGNVHSSATTYGSYADQEQFEIRKNN